MIALYSRVSTQEQVNGYSIGEQENRLQAYCDALNFKPYTLFTDAGFSGGTTDRPALQRLIRDVKNGKIDKVIVYKLDRLSRSQKDTLELIEDVFLRNGCDFISVSENFDTATPLGRAMIGILAVFAQLEREQIKERMQIGKEARTKEGKWRGGANVPVGYNYVDGKLEIEPFEAMQIRELFQLYADGKSQYEIERIFDQKGYAHKYGKWNGHKIRTTLTNELYIGNLKLGDETIKGIHDPIVNQEVWDQAQRIRKNRTVKDVSSNHSYLGGMLWCKQCGARYGTRQNGKNGNYRYYYTCYSRSKCKTGMIRDANCTNKIWRRADLEEIVFAEIRKLKLDATRISSPDAQEDRTDLILSEIKKLDAKREKLLDLYVFGTFDVQELNAKIEPLTEQKNRLERQLENDAENKKHHQQKVEMVQTFDDVLKYGTRDQIRLILEELIDKIELDNGDVYIHWSF